MRDRPKLLFDENFGKPAVHRLREFLNIDPDDDGSPEVRHLFDFHQSGVSDEEWIPQIANEGWVIITADRAKKPGKGGKLPRLCAEYGVTHVLLSGNIHRRSMKNKIRTILHVWGDLVQLYREPPGSRFMLEALSNKPEDETKGRLKRKKINYR